MHKKYWEKFPSSVRWQSHLIFLHISSQCNLQSPRQHLVLEQKYIKSSHSTCSCAYMMTTTSVSEESIDQCWKLLLQPFVIWRRSGPESFYTRFCWLAFSVSTSRRDQNSLILLCASNLNFVDGASLQGIHTPASSSDFLCCCCQNISGLKEIFEQ